MVRTNGSDLAWDDPVLTPMPRRPREIISGEVEPGSTPRDREITRQIRQQLCAQIERGECGEVYDAPVQIQLEDATVLEPDLVVMLGHPEKLGATAEAGTPDLVIDVATGARRAQECSKRRQLYENAGVQEYWIVDPAEGVVEQHRLRYGTYELVGTHRSSLRFVGRTFLDVDLSQVWGERRF